MISRRRDGLGCLGLIGAFSVISCGPSFEALLVTPGDPRAQVDRADPVFSELELGHRAPYKRAPAQLLGHRGDSIDLFLFHEKAAVPRNPFPSPRISRSYLRIYLHIY